MTDELVDAVQPDDGQGGRDTSETPYAEFLNRIPEEVRGDVEPVFKDWDANVTKRFQDASEYRKSWEPYEQAGVNKYDPAAVEWALQFYEAQQSNPQAIQEWFQAYAQQHGLEAAQQAAARLEQPSVDEFGYTDPAQQLEQMLAQRLTPFEQQLQQLTQTFQQQQEQQAIQAAQAQIEGQLQELADKHPGEFNREWVEKLLLNHIDTNPEQAVTLAWQDYQALRNQLEKSVFEKKANDPSPAEGGGLPDVNPEKITTFAQAKEIALQTLRNQNRP